MNYPCIPRLFLLQTIPSPGVHASFSLLVPKHFENAFGLLSAGDTYSLRSSVHLRR